MAEEYKIENIEENEEVDEEMGEVETTELVYDDGGIDDLITSLKELKKNKDSFSIIVDDNSQIIIHHEENPDLEFDNDLDDEDADLSDGDNDLGDGE